MNLGEPRKGDRRNRVLRTWGQIVLVDGKGGRGGFYSIMTQDSDCNQAAHKYQFVLVPRCGERIGAQACV